MRRMLNTIIFNQGVPMKRITFILIPSLILAVIIAACSFTPADPMVGKWSYQSVSTGTVTQTLTVNANGTAIMASTVFTGATVDYTWTVSGTAYTFTPVKATSASLAATLSGTTLNVVMSGTPMAFTKG